MLYEKIYILIIIYHLITVIEPTLKFDCDFENDLCNFNTNQFIIRYSGESPSISSGPSADRHKKNGSYVLCNGKILMNSSDECIMEKLIETTKEELILEFWFYQYGSQIGTLSLIINSLEVIWKSVGSQKNEWSFKSVNIPINTYKFEFRANRSIHGRFSSDIALDDISMSSISDGYSEIKKYKPTKLRGENFDQFGVLNGWHTEFKNYKWIQTDGSNINNMGPLSDYNSITNYVKSLSEKNTSKNHCSIPFTLASSYGFKEFYCKTNFDTDQSVCGLKSYPKISNTNDSIGKCFKGYYLTISGEFYQNAETSFRSRLFSPFFKIKQDIEFFYLSFSYNIVGFDSIKVFLEVISNKTQTGKILFSIVNIDGPFDYDKWELVNFKIETPKEYFRIVIQPYRRFFVEIGSVSIDDFEIFYENFINTDDTTVPVRTHAYKTKVSSESLKSTNKMGIIKKNIYFSNYYTWFVIIIGIALFLVIIQIISMFQTKKKTDRLDQISYEQIKIKTDQMD